MNRRLPLRPLVACLTLLLLVPGGLLAQTPVPPAFSLSSSQIFTSKDSPAITLLFQGVDGLDFRVYRVKDAEAFFAGLEDPHTLGSPAPVVPQEQTWLERVANWKAAHRGAIRAFFRRQVSVAYRVERRRTADRQTVQRRQTAAYRSFAQVPLLNAAQLVTSWREILPRTADTEARRLPLELPGPGVYLVEAVAAPHRAYTIVLVSDVGLLTKTAPGATLLFAANRFSGAPLPGCTTTLVADRQKVFSGTTGADGVATGTLAAIKPDALIALARCGDQTVATDASAWTLQGRARELVGYIYTDKPIYRPGHTVHLKGILRWRQRDALLPFDRPQVELSIVDPDDKVVLRQAATVDAFGAVKGTFVVPADAPLGYFSIRLAAEDETATGTFEVQEYRTPEFEVGVTPADRFVVQGRQTTVTVKARYYFGQPVARGSLTYVLYKASYYSPLRWAEDPDGEPAASYDAGDQLGEQTVPLDAQGSATFPITMPEDDEGRDYSLRIDARVTDASGREVSGRASVVGTHGDFLLAASLDRYVYRAGDPATVRIRAVDYTGAARAAIPVTAALQRVRWSAGETARETIATGSVTTDANGRASWTVPLPAGSGDSYQIRVSAASAGRTVSDDASLWIADAREGTVEAGDRYVELVADRASYAPGDTARLLMRGIDVDATVLVTKEGQAIAWHRVLPVARGAAIEVPIDEGDFGDVWVNIAFLRDNRLHLAEKRLRVPPTARGVQVAITPAARVARPRDPAIFTVTTTDAAGAPVSAQVSLAVIDEAVFAVKPDATPDPLRFFYRREYSRVGTQFSREYSFYGYSGSQELRLAGRRRPFALADFKADEAARPHVRKEFPDAVFWVADLVTDAAGTAKVTVAYPDALTTWRVTARAVTQDTRLGGAIGRTTTTKDVIVRLATPRFLTEGDAVRLPTVVHNYLPDARTIAVAVAADGLAAGGGAAAPPVSVEVPPGGEARAEWPFDARTVGTARVTARATTPGDGDALELPIPVLPYGTARMTGRSGSLSGPTEQAVELTIPDPSNPASRRIEVALAPSLAGSLFGALDALAEYPYGCTEQTVSSFFPNLAVIRALDALKIAPAERLRLVNRMTADGVTRLLDLQHDDGGFGWWKTDENHPFMTAYALWALAESLNAQQPVDRERVSRTAGAAIQLYAGYPRAVPTLKAWMLYALVRAQAAGIEPATDAQVPFDLGRALDALYADRSSLSSYGQALLVLALDGRKDPRAGELARTLAAAARTEGAISWWTSEQDPLLDDWMDTSVEATAFALRALAPHMPADPLLERAVRWLIANRDNGVWWVSTKQTAFALLGILDYVRARQETPATIEVEVEINGRVAGRTTFTPESWTQARPVVVSADGAAGLNRIRVRTRSGGTVYWTASARYHDTRDGLEQTGTRALALSRKYFALTPVEKAGRIVYRESPFTGSLDAGGLLLVRLVAAGTKDWKYLMLEDPLPAGLEAVKDDDLYELEKPPQWWYGSKREYRDTRIVQFQSEFTTGRYEYVYLLKAVTPGRFKAMPARLSPMYSPDVAATTGAQEVEVRSPGPAPAAAAAGASGARVDGAPRSGAAE